MRVYSTKILNFVLRTVPLVGIGMAGAEDRYDFSFHDIEVRHALRHLAEAAGRNLIVDDTVHGRMDINLVQVDFDEALSLILASQGLVREDHGRSIRVAGPERVLHERETKGLASALLTLRYLRADHAAALLEGRPINDVAAVSVSCHTQSIHAESVRGDRQGTHAAPPHLSAQTPVQTQATARPVSVPRLLGPRGRVLVHPTQNMILVQESPGRLAEVKALLARLDQPPQQVMIEARIVMADTDFSQALGVRLGGRKSSGQSTFVLPATLGDPGRAGLENTADLLRVELDAMERDQRGRIVANPRILSLNQQPAVILQGEQIPVQNTSTANNTTMTSTTYKDALLCLRIEPRILDRDALLLDIELQKDSRGQAIQEADQVLYPIDTRRLQTRVMARHGETVVLGGIFQEETGDVRRGLPLLQDIPLLGRLFRSDERSERRRELLVFLTPSIVGEEGVTAEMR